MTGVVEGVVLPGVNAGPLLRGIPRINVEDTNLSCLALRQMNGCACLPGVSPVAIRDVA